MFLGACASGASRLETLLHQVHPVDAVAIGTAGALLNWGMENDAGWSKRVSR